MAVILPNDADLTRQIQMMIQLLSFAVLDCFRNKRIYVHHTVKLCRRDVLHNLINKYGGELTLVPDDRTTHILVDEGISSRSLLRSLGWTAYPPFVDVLLLNWLSASIKANRCVDPIPYEIRSTHRRYYVCDYIDIEAENAAASTTTDHNSSLTATDNAVVTTAAESIDPITLADDDVVIPVINKEGSISESSSSSSELETLNSYFIDEEGSTYDDGKYDDETSCDDEWIRKLPNIPFNTQEFASSSVLPTSFCQSESNDDSVATKTVSNEKSNSSVPCIRPNTLAARLSRLRVKKNS
ncbi:BRCT domain-containing protein [Caerostris extrusa]|uniref:BRCT domain-containing protein n=1 Tax=Caerostris extrusa TaxID=172846 RepID=A0AAV4XR78_CAEEX|nr:BRCT domain-containing protein [Caerostris extrusa]